MATSAIVTVPGVDGELEIPCDILDVNEETGSLSLFRFDKPTNQFKLWAHFASYIHVYMVDDGKPEDPEMVAMKAALLADEDDEDYEDDEDEDDDGEEVDFEDDEEDDEDDEGEVVEEEVVVYVPAEAAEEPAPGPSSNSFSGTPAL